MPPITRFAREDVVTLTNSLATTAEIDIKDAGEIMLHAPAGYTTCALTFYVWNPATNVFQVLTEDDGTGLARNLVASESVRGPAELFAASRCKIVTNQAGNNAKPIGVTLKA